MLGEGGAGMGEGTTVNVPLPDGAGVLAVIKAFREILVLAEGRVTGTLSRSEFDEARVLALATPQ